MELSRYPRACLNREVVSGPFLTQHNPVAVIQRIEQQEDSTTSAYHRQALRSLRGYLTTNLDGLWYRDRLQRGLPIGSPGAPGMEGVCKTVIGRRFKHGGARQGSAAICSSCARRLELR